jgi:hypothetical protein
MDMDLKHAAQGILKPTDFVLLVGGGCVGLHIVQRRPFASERGLSEAETGKRSVFFEAAEGV